MAYIWLVYALGAAVTWGFTYAISEKLLRSGMPPSFLLLVSSMISLPLYLILSLKLETLRSGFRTLAEQTSLLPWVLAMGTAVVFGNFLIVMSVHAKNATLASLIEISYPIFTIFFAWLILREVQVNLYTALGGLLIFGGIATIYLKG